MRLGGGHCAWRGELLVLLLPYRHFYGGIRTGRLRLRFYLRAFPSTLYLAAAKAFLNVSRELSLFCRTPAMCGDIEKSHLACLLRCLHGNQAPWARGVASARIRRCATILRLALHLPAQPGANCGCVAQISGRRTDRRRMRRIDLRVALFWVCLRVRVTAAGAAHADQIAMGNMPPAAACAGSRRGRLGDTTDDLCRFSVLALAGTPF